MDLRKRIFFYYSLEKSELLSRGCIFPPSFPVRTSLAPVLDNTESVTTEKTLDKTV